MPRGFDIPREKLEAGFDAYEDRLNRLAKERCAWFGEGRGQCMLQANHAEPHRCEQDDRLVREHQHIWVGPRRPIVYVHCQTCGIIKNIGKPNGPCKGPVTIGPRSSDQLSEQRQG